MIELDLQSRVPIYEQLKNKIGELILAGELMPDDQLPSVRSFARDLGINPNTVQKAYQDLERDGIVYSVPGRGNYVSPNPNLITQLQKGQLNELKFAILECKASGIGKEAVFIAVEEVYGNSQNAEEEE